ncbi:hypothetical protein J6590_100472 [Homalodisca vitripennis]|nr:hypothetical protein J6590_100472 [Homalodisca vitripennis]
MAVCEQYYPVMDSCGTKTQLLDTDEGRKSDIVCKEERGDWEHNIEHREGIRSTHSNVRSDVTIGYIVNINPGLTGQNFAG